MLMHANPSSRAPIGLRSIGGFPRDRELAHAREVQRRLLDRACPPMPGVDYAGFCRSALEVGGDYYDFIRLSDTELGIAIGDVSGKGMPAALLMATLRAYVRGQMVHGLTDPAPVTRMLNRLVCESFSAPRYATFFYAHYDLRTRALHYVNAGHTPPFVFTTREGRTAVLRLDRGGPVLGLLPESGYVQGCVTLQPDDLVVAFTDGISEAMNADGEEWGEARLVQAIDADRTTPARERIERVVRAADAFVAAASQHDDMTLVTVRIT